MVTGILGAPQVLQKIPTKKWPAWVFNKDDLQAPEMHWWLFKGGCTDFPDLGLPLFSDVAWPYLSSTRKQNTHTQSPRHQSPVVTSNKRLTPVTWEQNDKGGEWENQTFACDECNSSQLSVEWKESSSFPVELGGNITLEVIIDQYRSVQSGMEIDSTLWGCWSHRDTWDNNNPAQQPAAPSAYRWPTVYGYKPA